MIDYYLNVGLFIALDIFFAERMLIKEKEVTEEHLALLALLLALSRHGHLTLSLEKIEEELRLLPTKEPCDFQPLIQMVLSASNSLPETLYCVCKDGDNLYLQK